MITVLGDLLADLALHFPSFPVEAKGMQPVRFLDLGPGGAGNVAIMSARFGLEVRCLGELGQDRFGDIVVEGLQAEGIETAAILRSEESVTPLAAVLVDAEGEPAYLGFPGRLQLTKLTSEWRSLIESSEALFADGWVESEAAAEIVLVAFAAARAAGVPVFFDPGPGNPRLSLDWHQQALAAADVLLLNQEEAERLATAEDPGPKLLERGPRMVMVKRGPAGCLALEGRQRLALDGYPVEAVDTTGAGDSFDAAVILGVLRGLELEQTARLANATGAAKVMKRGTGHNLPQVSEVRAVLERFGETVEGWER